MWKSHVRFGPILGMCARVYGWPEPYIYSARTVYLAGKAPNIRSYTVHKYSSGQPYSGAFRLTTLGAWQLQFATCMLASLGSYVYL